MVRSVTLVHHQTGKTKTLDNVTSVVVRTDRDNRPPSTRLEFAKGSSERDEHGDHAWFRHYTPVDE